MWLKRVGSHLAALEKHILVGKGVILILGIGAGPGVGNGDQY